MPRRTSRSAFAPPPSPPASIVCQISISNFTGISARAGLVAEPNQPQMNHTTAPAPASPNPLRGGVALFAAAARVQQARGAALHGLRGADPAAVPQSARPAPHPDQRTRPSLAPLDPRPKCERRWASCLLFFPGSRTPGSVGMLRVCRYSAGIPAELLSRPRKKRALV